MVTTIFRRRHNFLFILTLFGAMLLVCSYSCSKKQSYSEIELFNMAQKEDPNITFVLPKSITEGISCQNYPPGCLSGKTAELKKITIVVVQFDTEESAERAAKVINQYYARNWVFDDVTGEPVLEHFVKKVFDAKNPNLENRDNNKH